MRKIAHFLFCCASQLTSVKCDRAGFWRFSSLCFPLPSTCLRAVEKRWGEKTLPVVVKTMGNEIYRNGQCVYIAMGNKIYNDGQQNLPERATKFTGTGFEIYRNGL